MAEELWQRVHDRLAGARVQYARAAHGKLWRRPASGVESKFLLTGFAQPIAKHQTLRPRFVISHDFDVHYIPIGKRDGREI